MIADLLRLYLPQEVKISIPNPDDALDYLRVFVSYIFGILVSLPPAIVQNIKFELPVFIRQLNGEVELVIQYSHIMPIIRIRTNREILAKIGEYNYAGVLAETSIGTSLKLYKSKEEIIRDRERLLVLYRLFKNTHIELLHHSAEVTHGVV